MTSITPSSALTAKSPRMAAIVPTPASLASTAEVAIAPPSWVAFWNTGRLESLRIPFTAVASARRKASSHRLDVASSLSRQAGHKPTSGLGGHEVPPTETQLQVLRLRTLMRLLLVIAHHTALRNTPLAIPAPRPNLLDIVTGDVVLFPTVSWRGDVMDEATAVAWIAMAREEEAATAHAASHTGVLTTADSSPQFKVLLGAEVRGQLPQDAAANEQRLLRRLQQQLEREREDQIRNANATKLTASRYWDFHRAEKGATLFTDTPRLLPDVQNWINTALHNMVVRRLIRQYAPWVVMGTLFEDTVMKLTPDEEPTEDWVRGTLFDLTEEEAVQQAIDAYHAARRRGSTAASASASASSMSPTRRRSTIRGSQRPLMTTSSPTTKRKSFTQSTSDGDVTLAPSGAVPPRTAVPNLYSARVLRDYVDRTLETAMEPMLAWDAARKKQIAALKAKLLEERKRAVDRALFALTMNPQLARQIDVICRTEVIKRKGLLVAAYNDVEKILIRFGNLVVLGPKMPPFATVRDLRRVPAFVNVIPFGQKIDDFVDGLSGEVAPLTTPPFDGNPLDDSASDAQSPLATTQSGPLDESMSPASPRHRQVSFNADSMSNSLRSPTTTRPRPQPSRLLRLSVASMMWASALQDVHDRHSHLQDHDDDENDGDANPAVPAARVAPPAAAAAVAPPPPEMDFSAEQHRFTSWTEETGKPAEISPAPLRSTPSTFMQAVVKVVAEPTPKTAHHASPPMLPPPRFPGPAPLDVDALSTSVKLPQSVPAVRTQPVATVAIEEWTPSDAVRNNHVDLMTELLVEYMQSHARPGSSDARQQRTLTRTGADGNRTTVLLQRPPTTCVVVSKVLSMGVPVPVATPAELKSRAKRRLRPAETTLSASPSHEAQPFQFPPEYFDNDALGTLEYVPCAPTATIGSPKVKQNDGTTMMTDDPVVEVIPLRSPLSPMSATTTRGSVAFLEGDGPADVERDPGAVSRKSFDIMSRSGSLSKSTGPGSAARGPRKSKSSFLVAAAAAAMAKEAAAAERAAAAARAKHDAEVDAEVARQRARRSSKEMARAVELAGIELALMVGLPMATEMQAAAATAQNQTNVRINVDSTVRPAKSGTMPGEQGAAELKALLCSQLPYPQQPPLFKRPAPFTLPAATAPVSREEALKKLDTDARGPPTLQDFAQQRKAEEERRKPNSSSTAPVHVVRRALESPSSPCRVFPDPQLQRLASNRFEDDDADLGRKPVDLFQVSTAVDAAYKRALAMAAAHYAVNAPATGDGSPSKVTSATTPRPPPQTARPASSSVRLRPPTLDLQGIARQRAVLHRKHELALSTPYFGQLLEPQ